MLTDKEQAEAAKHAAFDLRDDVAPFKAMLAEGRISSIEFIEAVLPVAVGEGLLVLRTPGGR